MNVTLAVRAPGFRAMVTELSKLSGKSYRDILASEAASCVKIAALESPIATKSEIEQQVQERESGHWDTELGEYSVNRKTNRGRVWFWDKDAGGRAEKLTGPVQPGKARHTVSRGGFYMLFDAGPSRGNRVPPHIWFDYLSSRNLRTAIVAAEIKERVKRRGTERLSWIQITDAMGINLANVAPLGGVRENIARRAKVRGRQFGNGRADSATYYLRFQITVTNASPVAVKRWGQRRIENAMRRRRRNFEIAMKKGLLDDLTQRAKRWPGIFVKPA